ESYLYRVMDRILSRLAGRVGVPVSGTGRISGRPGKRDYFSVPPVLFSGTGFFSEAVLLIGTGFERRWVDFVFVRSADAPRFPFQDPERIELTKCGKHPIAFLEASVFGKPARTRVCVFKAGIRMQNDPLQDALLGRRQPFILQN